VIKHIVFFRFHELPAKMDVLMEVKSQIDALQYSVPGVIHIEAGINISTREVAWDIALVSDFESESDLDLYRDHPAHQALLVFLKQYRYEVSVVDYQY